MPGFIKTAAQEAKWKRAKRAVSRSRHKKKKDFQKRDWGLVTHIYQGIKKAINVLQQPHLQYVVYSVVAKSGKKVYHQSYEDMSDAQEHKKNLQRLYKGYIQVGIEEKIGKFKSSVMKASLELEEKLNGKNRF